MNALGTQAKSNAAVSKKAFRAALDHLDTALQARRTHVLLG